MLDSDCAEVSFEVSDADVYSRLALGLEVFFGFTEIETKKAHIPISTINATLRMRFLYVMFHFLVVRVPFFRKGISDFI